MSQNKRRSWIWTSIALIVLLCGVALIWVSYEPAPPDIDVHERHPSASVSVTPSPNSMSPSASATPRTPAACGVTTAKQFAPTKFTIVGKGSWPALGLNRDKNNRPVTAIREGLPLWDFIYDKQSPPPNYGSGVFYGGAHRAPNVDSLGNLMLRELSVGDLALLSDKDGNRVCLRVYERIEVPVEKYPNKRVFNVTRQPQEYVFDICSGVRRGPGDWSKATLMFLRPV